MRRHGLLALAAATTLLSSACGSDTGDSDAAPSTTVAESTTTAAAADDNDTGQSDAAASALDRLGDIQFLCDEGMQVNVEVDGEPALVEIWDDGSFGIIVNPVEPEPVDGEPSFWFTFSAINVGAKTLVEWDHGDGEGFQWYSVDSNEMSFDSFTTAQYNSPLDYACGGVVWDDYVSSLWGAPELFEDPDDPNVVIVDLNEYDARECAIFAEEMGADAEHLGELGLAAGACPTNVTALDPDASDAEVRELRDGGSRMIIRANDNLVESLDLSLSHAVLGGPSQVSMSFTYGTAGVELPNGAIEIEPAEFHEMTSGFFALG